MKSDISRNVGAGKGRQVKWTNKQDIQHRSMDVP